MIPCNGPPLYAAGVKSFFVPEPDCLLAHSEEASETCIWVPGCEDFVMHFLFFLALSLSLHVDVCHSSQQQSGQIFSHGEARPFPPAPVRMPK